MPFDPPHWVVMASITVRKRRPASPLYELRAPTEFGLFAASGPLLSAAPRGNRRVLVLPGFLAADGSTAPLRRALRQLGHRPVGWGLGRNVGPVRGMEEGLLTLLERQAEMAGRPIPIIGWSLGGIYARVMASDRPDLVDQVITLGSPFNIHPDEYTSVNRLYEYMARTHDFERDRESLDVDQIDVPSTAAYTRTDGIVAWQGCLQSEDEQSENIEVYGSHCGLGTNFSVAYLVADRLRHTKATWQPFEPPRVLRCLYPDF